MRLKTPKKGYTSKQITATFVKYSNWLKRLYITLILYTIHDNHSLIQYRFSIQPAKLQKS